MLRPIAASVVILALPGAIPAHASPAVPAPSPPVALSAAEKDAEATDPGARAREMLQSRTPAAEAATAIQREFRLGARETGGVLVEAGFPPRAVASALQETLRATPREVVGALLDGGARGGELSAVVQEVGLDQDDLVVEVLGSVADEAEAGGILRDAGVAPERLARGMMALAPNPDRTARILLQESRDAGEALAAVRVAAEATTPGEAALQIMIPVAVQIVAQAGGSASETVASMESAGYSHLAIGEVLKEGYGLDAAQAAAAMREGGMNTAALGVALRDVFGLSHTEAPALLLGAGFPADETTRILRTSWGTFHYQSSQVFTLLLDTGYPAEAATAAISGEWAGFTLQDAVNGMAGHGVDPEDAGEAAAAHASSPGPMEIVEAMLTVAVNGIPAGMGELKDDWLSPAGVRMKIGIRRVAQAAGAGAKASGRLVARAARRVGVAARGALELVTESAEIPWPDAAELVHEAGYAWDEVAGATQELFQATALQVAEIAERAGVAAQVAAAALRELYDLGAQETAQLLTSAGYAASGVLTALQQAFQMTSAAAQELLQALGGGGG